MFGLVVAGRLVDTAPQQTDAAKFVFNVTDADTVNHLTVFMTGTQAFPDGLGASIYFGWPGGAGGGVTWQMLGVLTNDKPSAIFKIASTRPNESDKDADFGGMSTGETVASLDGQIGISIEPVAELAQQTPHQAATASTASDYVAFTGAMLESFFNFATSFANTREGAAMHADEHWVPLGCLNRWQENFQRKLALDPAFWKK